MTGSPTPGTPSLRERRRRETRLELAAAALELFERQGLHHTTTDQIAEAAGISPRTFFRYAETKEHALFADDDGFDILIARVRDSLAAGVDVISAIERAHLDLLDDFEREPSDRQSRVLRVRRLVIAEPSLLALALASDAERAGALLEIVLSADPSVSDLDARTVLTAMGTTLRLSFDEWVISAERGERVSVRSLHEQVHRRLKTYFTQ